MATQSLKKRKIMTQTSDGEKEIEDEIKEAFMSLNKQMAGQELVAQQWLKDLKIVQETALGCLEKMLVEIEETEGQLKFRRTEVAREIQNVKTSAVENTTQMSELERGMKMHEEFTGKLKETPSTVIGQHFEELHMSLKATYTDMEKRRKEGELTKQDLQFRLDELENEVEKITQDQLQNENKKEKLLCLKELNELVTVKTYQSMLNLASEKLSQKEEDRSKILDLKKQLLLLSSTKDEEIQEMKRQKEQCLSKILDLKKQLDLLSSSKDKEISEMKRQKDEDMLKILDLKAHVELLSRSKDKEIRLKEEGWSKILDLTRQKDEGLSKILELKKQLELLSGTKDTEISETISLKEEDLSMILDSKKLMLPSSTKDKDISEMTRLQEEDGSKFFALEQRHESCSKTEQRKDAARIPVKKGAAPTRKPIKDPNKPKRPLCAFLVFMEEFRVQFLQKNGYKISVAVLGRDAGLKWKSMSPFEMTPYLQIAEKRKIDYEKRITEYEKGMMTE